MAEGSSDSDVDQAQDEHYRGIFVRLSTSGLQYSSEDDEEDDIETMRINPLTLLLHRLISHSRPVTRSQTSGCSSAKKGKGETKPKSAKQEPPDSPHVNSPLPKNEDLHQRIQMACGLKGGYQSYGLFQKLLEREYGRSCSVHRMSQSTEERAINEHCVPSVSDNGQIIYNAHSSAFCGKYSNDGNFLAIACQDGRIPVYVTEEGSFRQHCTIQARYVGWTVIEVAFSPDNCHLCYGTWSPLLHHCNVVGDRVSQTSLDLRPDDDSFATFGIFYSPDGSSVAASASDGCVYVYDLYRGERVLKIPAHEDHANALCCSKENDNVMFSGGDDGLCRVWDRRVVSEGNARAVGVFSGHRDGLTYIDAKTDGYYVITNSKDQSVKLWDLRKFSTSEGLKATRNAVRHQMWDYRWQRAPRKLNKQVSCEKLPGDVSVMTYTGHRVQHTLIRCKFSPVASTGERYIYTGGDGTAVIYDILTGQKIKELDCAKNRSGRARTVRDVSWHPYRPHLVTSCWDGLVRLWTPAKIAHSVRGGFGCSDSLGPDSSSDDDAFVYNDAR